MLHGCTQAMSCSRLHGHTQAMSCSHLHSHTQAMKCSCLHGCTQAMKCSCFMVAHKLLILVCTLRISTHIWLVSKMMSISYAVYKPAIFWTYHIPLRNLCNSELMSLWTRIRMKIRRLFTVKVLKIQMWML